MPKKISLEDESFLRGLVAGGMSYTKAAKTAKNSGIHVTSATVSNLCNYKGKHRQARLQGRVYHEKHTRHVRTTQLVNRIKSRIIGENPKPLKTIAREMDISRTTLARVVYEDLKLRKKKKRQVHVLTEANIENRRLNSLKLYNKIRGHKSEFAVTIDEAMFYYIPGQHLADVVYLRPGEEMPPEFVKQCHAIQPKHVMVIAGMTGRGPLRARIVPEKTKINADYYRDHVLKPIFQKELPKIYPGELDKVFFHQDKAPSHMAHKTFKYLEELRKKHSIDYQKKEHVVVKGADCSPMDFFGFGWLKYQVKKTRVKSWESFCKTITRRWSELSPETCANVYRAWKRRCQQIHKMSGKHIEQTKDIHLRKNN